MDCSWQSLKTITDVGDAEGMNQATPSTEFRDSRNRFGDSQALRERVATDGYVFMRALLDPMMVRSVGRTGLAHLQTAGGPSRKPIRSRRDRDFRSEPRRFAPSGNRDTVRSSPTLASNMIPFVSPLADLMTQILGPEGFCYPLKIPRIVYPATLVPHQPGNYVHMDYGSVQDMFTCWVPVGDIPRTLGGLAVNPGSQQTTRVHHRSLDQLPSGWLTADYQAGDVLVFHCLTAHAALPNLENRLRFSAEYRWQLADQPAPRRMVIGPQGHELGSRMFSHTPWWHPVSRGLTLFDDGGPQARTLPAPPSRFVEFTT